MSQIAVLKFGGTSVGEPHRMKHVAELVTQDNRSKIVVLSALSKTTNTLVDIATHISKNETQKALSVISSLEKHCDNFINSLFSLDRYKNKAKRYIKGHFEILRIFTKISFSQALERDILSHGELMSTHLFSFYLEEQQINHILLPALDFMMLNENWEPDYPYIEKKLKNLISKNKGKKLYITQGYICRNHRKEVDNLQRGGSDYTASIIASVLKAQVCEIWTDIDGMHNNDPRIVTKTKSIEQLNFDEAAELAYFGAKILHPTCIFPAQQKNVPVKLLNTMNPKAKGTTISVSKNQFVGAKAVAAKDDILAIKIKSSRMLLAYGFLKKVFEVFETYKTSIDMITTSEVAISLTIDNTSCLHEIERDLKKLGEVEIDYNMTIVCIVGYHLVEEENVLQKIFRGLKVPIRMVSFGGSKNNISILITTDHKKDALQQLNEGIFNLV
ncbi:MAG: aspartate kinase [Chitinophagaceae bacterium]